jgi:hypothetical protein
MVFMAHLSLVSSDLVCGSRGAATRAMSGMGATDMNGSETLQRPAVASRHSAMAIVSGARGTDEAPCQVPSSNRCCDAMIGCAITMAATNSVIAQQPPATDTGVSMPGTVAPASRLTAPEPPPPKA